eukprot:1834515-Prymnesium_polylepis.1
MNEARSSAHRWRCWMSSSENAPLTAASMTLATITTISSEYAANSRIVIAGNDACCRSSNSKSP